MANYSKGRSFEYRSVDIFRKHKYECNRKAGSSPYDVVAYKKGKVVFIAECKKTMKEDIIYISKKDIEKLSKEAKKQGATPVILYGFARSPVFVALPRELKTKGKMYKLIKNNNETLDNFLKSLK